MGRKGGNTPFSHLPFPVSLGASNPKQTRAGEVEQVTVFFGVTGR